MTLDQRKLAREGCDYWFQYVRLNWYAFRPTRAGLSKFCGDLDVSVEYLAWCITT